MSPCRAALCFSPCCCLQGSPDFSPRSASWRLCCGRLTLALVGALLPCQVVGTRKAVARYTASGAVWTRSTSDICSPALLQHAHNVADVLEEFAKRSELSPAKAVDDTWKNYSLYAEARRFPLTAREARSLSDSLEAGCHPLDPGAASNSNAKLASTSDGLWVVKAVKRKENAALLDIAGFSYSYGKRWAKLPLVTAEGFETKEVPDHSQGAGHYKWESNFCSHDDIQAKLPNCYTEEDPKFMYRRYLERNFSLMVPIVLHVPSLFLVVMPNIRRLPDTSSTMTSVLTSGNAPLLEKYDTKPLQVSRSAERAPLLARLAELQLAPATDHTLRCPGLEGVACWSRLVDALRNDLRFLSAGRRYEFVDYSLVFLIGDADGSLLGEADHVMLEGMPRQCLLSQREKRSTILCVYLIDYLMAKTTSRQVESWLKDGKFDEYSESVEQLMFCVGDMQARPCRFHLEVACQHAEFNDSALGESFDIMRASNTDSAQRPFWCRKLLDVQTCREPDPRWSCRSCPSSTATTSTLSCEDLAGKHCLPKHAFFMGFSPMFQRTRSAVEACCCTGLGKTFPYVSVPYTDSFGNAELIPLDVWIALKS